MAIPHYLAMTAEEMATSPLPRQAAWMACHFSPYSTGLTNLPESLPEGCLLILNDRTPIHGHDPERILRELSQILERFNCPGLLVDFQNPGNAEAEALVGKLAAEFGERLIVSQPYAREDCTILLPPTPTDVLLSDYLASWKGRKLWLETALEGQTITLTKSGAAFSPNRNTLPDPHAERELHCHYSIQGNADSIVFRTWRNVGDLNDLLNEAEALDIIGAVGLYQEIGQYISLGNA